MSAGSRFVFFGLFAQFTCALAHAQAYPVKPLRMIVPFAAGGTTASTPEQFAAHIKSELAKWAKVIQAAGARVD